jgi:murein DD-endopeptidase MepM/ murein hydrolase activator NlpD
MVSKNSYRIPFPDKIKIMALSDPRVHFGNFKEAIDFIIPSNTPILAAEEGTVEEIKLNSKQGGINKKFANVKYLNYIVLKHKNKEFTTYGHLKYKSSKLKKADFVKKGEIIAYSGRSGLMTIPHLHFHVFKKKKKGWDAIEPLFNIKFNLHIPKTMPKKYSNLFTFLEERKKKILKKS